MHPIRFVAIAALASCGAGPAWALAGGGTAPGGPLSGTVRPSCNGHNMDGTINAAPDARWPGCVDRSARGLRRPGGPVPSPDE